MWPIVIKFKNLMTFTEGEILRQSTGLAFFTIKN